MATFRRITLGFILAAVGSMSSAQDAEIRTVDLTVEGHKVGLAFVYETDKGLMVSEDDIPAKRFESEKYDLLPRYDKYPCAPCLRIDDIGTYFEDKKTTKASIAIRPSLMPVRNISLTEAESAEAKYLQRGFNLQGTTSVTARADDTDAIDGYAGVLDLSLSLGKFGVLFGGYRETVDNGISTGLQLPVFLENHFADQRITYHIGETQIDSDPNEPGVSVKGIRVFRNFRTRPDLISSPLLDFYTDLQRPSVVDLYINSQKVKSREFDEPGPVQLNDYRPSTSGKVMLVVTDVLGSQRVIEVDFYNHSRLLGKGVSDFNIGVGNAADNQGGTVDDTWVAGGSYRYGINNQLTLGANYGLVDSDIYRSEIVGYTGTAGVLFGTVDMTARFSSDSDYGEGNSYRLSWQANKAYSNGLRLGMGFAGFKEDNYTAHFGTPRDLEGGRVYAAISDRQVSIGGNYSDLGETESKGIYFSYAPMPRLSWSMSYNETLDKASQRENKSVAFAVSLHLFENKSGLRSMRYNTTRQLDSQSNMHDVTVAGSNFDDHLAWNTRGKRIIYGDVMPANGDDNPELYDSSLSWNSDDINATYLFRKYGDDLKEHLFDASTGFSIGQRAAFNISTAITPNSGLAVVDTGFPGVTVMSGSSSSVSDWRGLAAVPVSGFGRSYASIDPQSLPYGVIPKEVIVDVSVYPGQSSFGKLEIAAPAVFITIDGAKPGDKVMVNGSEQTYYKTGVFTEEVVLGKNSVSHKGVNYKLDIDEIDTSFPTYEVGK